MKEAARLCALRADSSRNCADPGDAWVHPRKRITYTSLLADSAAFKSVSPVHIERLARASHLIKASNGEEVLSQGAPADGVFVILSGEGRVRIEWVDRQSKRFMVRVLRRGEIFGELSTLTQSTRTATATIEGQLGLLRIDPQVFLEVLSQSPELGANICRFLGERLRRASELCQDSTFQSVEARLARQILYLVESDGRRIDCGLRVPGRLRETDLADLVGITTRSVIKILNKWRRQGIVKYDTRAARLAICHEAYLRALLVP